MIATTLNIHINVLSRITYASEKIGVSRRKIIILLLMQMMKDTRLRNRGFSTVMYQCDDIKENWRCFHIRFREDENEFFVDLRKFSKYSVSYLLAMAVERYLSKILENCVKFIDNYNIFNNYILHRYVIEGIISWHIYWGLPKEHIKTLKL